MSSIIESLSQDLPDMFSPYQDMPEYDEFYKKVQNDLSKALEVSRAQDEIRVLLENAAGDYAPFLSGEYTRQAGPGFDMDFTKYASMVQGMTSTVQNLITNNKPKVFTVRIDPDNP